MTAFRLNDTPGPGTHVFLIGVGAYPHLKDGSGRLNPRHRDLGQLTSSPVSAMAMLEWVDRSLNNPEAPLKSIEVLISQPGVTAYTDTEGLTQEIDSATWENFEVAAQAWFDRANTDPENVALFYFCGHGIGDGVNTYLLMQDSGASHDFLRHALHVSAFRVAMGACRAQKQLFLVDACRTLDLATVLNPHNSAQSGLVPGDVMQVFDVFTRMSALIDPRYERVLARTLRGLFWQHVVRFGSTDRKPLVVYESLVVDNEAKNIFEKGTTALPQLASVMERQKRKQMGEVAASYVSQGAATREEMAEFLTPRNRVSYA